MITLTKALYGEHDPDHYQDTRNTHFSLEKSLTDHTKNSAATGCKHSRERH